MLFLYTDGITEARSPELAYFADRLEDELSLLAGQPPKDIVTAMQAAGARVQRERAARRHDDDGAAGRANLPLPAPA